MRRLRDEQRTDLDRLMRDLTPGDIVQVGRNLRTILQVSKCSEGWVTHLTFSIMRCSWTRRPTTSMNRVDLHQRKLKLVKKRKLPDDFITHTLIKDAQQLDGHDTILKCCDVAGVYQ